MFEKKIPSEISYDYSDAIVFKRLRVYNTFPVHAKTKSPRFQILRKACVFKFFEKLRFSDRLVRPISLTVEINLRFQMDLAWMEP